jgi:hypothetical protein
VNIKQGILICCLSLSCSTIVKRQGKTIEDTPLLAKPKIRECYETLLDSDKNLNYSFKALININALGFVTKVELDNKKIPIQLKNCIKVSIFELRFPSSMSGKSLDLIQPINLYPKQ